MDENPVFLEKRWQSMLFSSERSHERHWCGSVI